MYMPILRRTLAMKRQKVVEQTLRLRHDGYSYRDIGDMVGKSPTWVMNVVRQGDSAISTGLGVNTLDT